MNSGATQLFSVFLIILIKLQRKRFIKNEEIGNLFCADLKFIF